MINCQTFRAHYEPATDEAVMLEHVRACDACLQHAAMIDPDVIFRAIGGGEIDPPGGVDAFVDDVMRQVRVRATENTMSGGRLLSWPRRMAIAATLAAGFSGAMLLWIRDQQLTPVRGPIASVRPAIVQPISLASKPVIETYASNNATIVEVPSESADTQIVMIFDENLPADL